MITTLRDASGINIHRPYLLLFFSFFKSEDSDERVEWQETGSESSAEHLELQ